jgi:hypothetical protein
MIFVLKKRKKGIAPPHFLKSSKLSKVLIPFYRQYVCRYNYFLREKRGQGIEVIVLDFCC